LKKIKYFAENKNLFPTLRRTLLISYILLSTVLFAPAFAAGGPDTAEPIVRLYPNPATSVVNLDLGSAVNRGYSIQVFSFLGRKMYEATNVTQRITLSLTDYNRGVYIYQLRDRNGKLVETGKFQVSK
jgi:hypothetical protein